jgi:hypothetical protein
MWNSIEDKPAPDGPLLVYCGDSYAGYHIAVLINYGGRWNYPSGSSIDFHGNITHWMHLPLKPRMSK